MVKDMKPDRQMEKKVDPGSGKIIHTPDGSEDHSNSGGPMAISFLVGQRDNLGDRVREMIRSERLALAALEEGYETFEEADDFDVDEEDYDPQTPYEEIFEGSVSEDMKKRREQQEAALRKIDPDKLELLLGHVDKETLDKVLGKMGRSRRPPDKAPPGVEGDE